MKKLLTTLILTGLLQSCGFELVDDGYVGIKQQLGKIEPKEYEPGIHFYNPITTSIFEMEIREKSLEEKTSAYSSDNQIIDVTYKVNFKPVKEMMAELYISQGDEYVNVLLPQRVQASVKEIIGQHKATNLVQVRNKVNIDIRELLTTRLDGTNLKLVAFEVTNFDYDDDFERAVKAKIVAKERAIEEKNRTVQIQEQSKQKVLKAEAEAKAITITAEALAKNKDLIQLEAVKKWNGVLPKFSGGTVPFINVDKMGK